VHGVFLVVDVYIQNSHNFSRRGMFIVLKLYFMFCYDSISLVKPEIFAVSRHSRGYLLQALLTRLSQFYTVVVSGNSLRQTVHTHCASVHQAAKLVAAVLRVAMVTAGLAESNGVYDRRVYESHHLQADCQEPGSAPQPYAR